MPLPLPGLRYLEFHHVDTVLLDATLRIADARPGLREVEDMNTLIKAIDKLSLKPWFRTQMGMDKG